MKFTDMIRVWCEAGIEFADRFDMQDARLDSLGARREPPKETGELTDVIRSAIIASRAESSEEDWLRANGRRDQECVRYGITRDQAAAILAGATKRERKDERVTTPIDVAVVATPQPKQRTRIAGEHIVIIPVERGGNASLPPTNRIRAVDQTDESIVHGRRHACDQGRGDWQIMKQEIGALRRLTTKQIDGVVASLRQRNKLGPAPKPTREVRAPTAQA